LQTLLTKANQNSTKEQALQLANVFSTQMEIQFVKGAQEALQKQLNPCVKSSSKPKPASVSLTPDKNVPFKIFASSVNTTQP
jgi:hypothetical protein